MINQQIESHVGGRIQNKSWVIRLKVKVISYIAFFVVWLLHKTLRYEICGDGYRAQAEKEHPHGSVLITSWHQNTILGVTSLIGQPYCLLVSSSLDGEIISYVAHKLGLVTLRGSSSQGGKKALLKLLRYSSSGGKIAVTVDGPRGPAFEVKSGVLFLSQKNRVPILPMSCVSDKYWTLTKTWDQFRIPKPFSTVKVIFGPPFIVGCKNKKKDLLDFSFLLKKRLNDLELNVKS